MKKCLTEDQRLKVLKFLIENHSILTECNPDEVPVSVSEIIAVDKLSDLVDDEGNRTKEKEQRYIQLKLGDHHSYRYEEDGSMAGEVNVVTKMLLDNCLRNLALSVYNKTIQSLNNINFIASL